MSEDSLESVLEFWFGPLDPEGHPEAARSRRWWTKDPAFDAEVRERFLPLYEAVVRGALQAPKAQSRARLSQIIVLDQFSRNMFRDQAQMYAGDAQAQAMVREGLDARLHESLATSEQVFFFMPLMHSETVADQERCVQCFEDLAAGLVPKERERVEGFIKYAIQHRDIVVQFGRFPHRNEILGRETTSEEVEFLKTPGSSF